MNKTGLVFLLAAVGCLFLGPSAARAEDEAAIAAVQRHNGDVKRDDTLPGKPVVEIDLTLAPALGVAELRPLAAFRRLHTLRVRIGRLTPAMVTELQSLKSLKSLTLHVWDCSGLDAKALTQFPALEGLELRGSAVTDAVLKRVIDLGSDSAAPGVAGGRGLGALRREPALPRLRHLSLTDTSVTDEGLKQLAALRGLEHLALTDNKKLTEEGLGQIARLGQLKGLHLSQGGMVTDATLTKLTALTGLQSLALHGAGVTDAGLKEVARFKYLSEFSLCADQVSDAGLMELAAAKQLTRVSVFPNAQTTDAAAGRLKEALGERADVTVVRAAISQVPIE